MPPIEQSPSRPALTVQLGVTGHRALPGVDPEAIRHAAAELFRAVAATAARLHAEDQGSAAPLYAAAPPVLRCLCGLAEGADSLLAEAALQEGWAVVAVLPFAVAEFEQDFAGAARERFRALLARAATVSALDGERGRGGEPYAAVGRLVVEQSDLMLAVWDGLPARGPGGTGDVVQQALERGIPVGVLPASGTVRLSWRGADDLGAILRRALWPDPDPGGFPHAYFRETAPNGGWARTAVRWYERAVLLGVRPAAAGPPAQAETPAADGLVAGSERRLLPPFTQADRLASAYATRYRAAGLLRYGMVIPATLGSFIGVFGPGWAQPLGYVLQFASLVAMLVFSARGGWVGDQRRFIAYRALAEYLRNARLLLPLGALATPPPRPVHQEPPADWTSWYGRAVLREVGVLGGCYDRDAVAAAARFVRAQAGAEIAFLLGRASRFTAMAARLQRIGVALSLCGIGFVALHGVLVLTGVSGRPVDWFNALALVLPAMAPIFLGLLGFGEYGRLATRYRAVAAALQAQLAALEQAPPRRDAVLPIARRIAEVMLAESADWQLLIKARTLSVY